MKERNLVIPILIVLTNLYFLPFSVLQIIAYSKTGVVEVALQISLSINFLLLTAGFAIWSRFSKSVVLFIINVFGLFWTFFWLVLLLTVPQME